MLLCLNPRRCPCCGFDTASLDATNRACTSCGVRLWKSSDDFGRYELEQGILHYYVWYPQLGWVHADRIRESFRPNQPGKTESLLVSY